MKLAMKRILLAGLALLVVGALIALAALFSMKFDFHRLNTRQNVTKTYTPEGDFDDILISTESSDVTFLPAEDGKLKIVCVEEKSSEHIVSTLSGKLTIQEVDTRDWYENIGVNFDETSVTVYLPKKAYGSLNLGAGTGDVEIPADFSFTEVLMSASTGDISLRADVGGSVSIQTSTGEIILKDLRAASLDLTADTGEVLVSGCTAEGSVKVQTSTGDVSLSSLRCAEAQVRTTTGDVRFADVLVSGSLHAETDTGDVRFDRSDAPEIRVETDTGDVTGTLLTPKTFDYHTGTGSVDLPRSESGGVCELESHTGDFKLGIAG